MSNISDKKIMFFVTEDWYFCSHRIELAKALIHSGYEVYLVTRVNKHEEQIKGAGINLIPINIERSKLNVFSDLKLILSLFKIYRNEKPDIVHHVAVKPVIYGSIAAFFSGNRKVVNALGGLGFIFSSSNLKAIVLRFFVKIAFRFLLGRKESRLIVQNKDDFQLFSTQFGIKLKQISIIRGAGVDNKLYQPLPEPKGKVVVTLLARMLVDKGVYEFVQAAKISKFNGLNVDFYLVGDPDPLNPASIHHEVLLKWNEEGFVYWTGFESNISSVWASSHISVLPSYREGLPKSLLESAACGRAIVTTDVPGCREVVTDGINGLLVPAKDAKSLAEAIEKLAKDSAMRKKMGINGRRLIDEELSADKVHEQTICLYKEILN
jgi:glycosyltransferase involved in cell wall biosynthesis